MNIYEYEHICGGIRRRGTYFFVVFRRCETEIREKIFAGRRRRILCEKAFLL